MGTAGVDSTADIIQAMAPGTLFDEPPAEVETPGSPFEGRVSEPAQPDAEPPAEGEPGEEKEPEEQGEPGQETQSYDDLLPAKQQKAYSEELLARAAEKFGVDPGLLDNAGVKSLLKGKIDSDILIASRAREAEVAQREAQDKSPQARETPALPAEYTFPQIAQMTQAIAKAHVTDEGAAYVGPLLYKSLSSYADAVESGDEAKVKEANRDLTTALMQFGVMMMAEMSPVIFAQQFYSAMDNYARSPQFREHLESYEAGQDAETSLYDEAMDLLAKEPGFRDVNTLRDKGEIDRVAEDYFQETGQELSSLQFRNRENGQPLPALQNAMAQYRYAVRLLRGGQYQDPTEVARRGVEAGRRRERQNQNRNALGRFNSGRQSGQFERGGDDADDFMKSMQDAVGREAPMSDLQFVSNLVSR
jgi:hypothetical protein